MWDENFPPVYGHTSVSFLKSCPGFAEAKCGDLRAAVKVVNLCVKQPRIDEIIKNFPDAVLLPVITRNRLPEAFALKIGLKTHTGLRVLQNLNRKKMSGMERLLHKPDFIGKSTGNENYIILDDIISQGGTVSALRNYVLARGGFVCAVAVLARSEINGSLAPKSENIHRLSERFNYTHINDILRRYRISNDLSELTNSEIRYLLRFKNAEQIINKIDSYSNGMPLPSSLLDAL